MRPGILILLLALVLATVSSAQSVAPSSRAALGAPAATSALGAPAAVSALGAPAAVSALGAPVIVSALGAPAAVSALGPPATASALGAPVAASTQSPPDTVSAQSSPATVPIKPEPAANHLPELLESEQRSPVMQDTPETLIVNASQPNAFSTGPTAWLRAEYLLWWIRPDSPGPLVTTGPAASDGVLGRDGVSVLCDSDTLKPGAFSGFRLDAGWWFDRTHQFGVTANGFILGSQTQTFRAGSDASGSPVLARPTIIAQTGENTSELIAFPDAFNGTVRIASKSQLGGYDVNLLMNARRGAALEVQALIGFRYLQLDECLTINQQTYILNRGITGFGPDILLEPDGLNFRDSFRTVNRFYGGQLGLRAVGEYRALSFDFTGKVALGSNHQTLSVQGSTTHLIPQGVGARLPGGILALPTNSGNFNANDFAVATELGVQTKYRLTRHLLASVGYSVLWWNNVTRPGEQIDRRIDRAQLPSSLGFDASATPIAPLPRLQQSNFWAQGLNFGLELQY